MASLTDIEHRQVDVMMERLSAHWHANRKHESYYDGSFKVKFLGIGLPEQAKRLELVAGWPATVVDVLEERLDFQGWESDALSQVYSDNALGIEASQIHLDALIHGVSFVSVTAGGVGEPDILVRGHHPNNATGIVNPRTGRIDVGLTREVDSGGEVIEIALWTDTEIVISRRARESDSWEVMERVPHGLGMVPLVPLINRPRVGDRYGKSEITKALRGFTDSASRALVAMDVNREFFSSPQRYALNVNAEDFVGADGRQKSGWEMITGRMWMVPPDEDGAQPSLGQFDAISPGPYLEQIHGLAKLVAAEGAIPPTYLGFSTDNPSSADAIKQMEARLVKRAERRQTQFGRAWGEVGRLVESALSGTPATELPLSKVLWAAASTPTVAASMDAAVKAINAGIADGQSDYILDLIGASPEQRKQLKLAAAQSRAQARMNLMTGVGTPADDEQAGELARANREVSDDGGQ